ncbi:MAG: dehydrogenase, partial [Acidobacteria bacterium]|nr:dehydrogenase [Acidobacteriota bacterium]
MGRNFQVSLTFDFMPAAGEPDVGLDLLRAEACVEYQLFRSMPPEVAPEQIADFDALLLGGQRLTREMLNGQDMRLSVLARLGVGYDRVDVEALTDNEVLLTITPDGIRRPMATAIVTLILALTHEVADKDRLFRATGWARRLEIEGRGV